MMLMPFVRLLAIYALVGGAIYSFLNRDHLMAYFGAPEAAQAEVADAIVYTTAAAQAPTVTPQPPINQSLANVAPAFGAEITPQYFGQTSTPPAKPTPQAGPSMVERWQNARDLYSQGHSTAALEIYSTLAAENPNNADIHGEVGNLFYNLGQFSTAATHYYEVGVISVRKGDLQMAQYMWTLLQRLAPAKAAELGAVLNARR